MAEKKKQELKVFPWKSVPGAPTMYANITHVGWTIDDLRLTFGALRSETINGKDDSKTVEQGSVVIPWRQAKNLAAVLSRVVEDYEKKNGEITAAFLADPDNQGPVE
jgi:Protein of unknown function (DUF3467)